MSDYERHVGKIKKIDIKPYEFEGFLVSKLSEKDLTHFEDYTGRGNEFDNNDELIDWYDSINEKYFISGVNLYEFIEKEEKDTTHDIYDAKLNEDGTINFHVMFYNGACCMSEAIEEAIKQLEKEGK